MAVSQSQPSRLHGDCTNRKGCCIAHSEKHHSICVLVLNHAMQAPLGIRPSPTRTYMKQQARSSTHSSSQMKRQSSLNSTQHALKVAAAAKIFPQPLRHLKPPLPRQPAAVAQPSRVIHIHRILRRMATACMERLQLQRPLIRRHPPSHYLAPSS